MQDRHTIAFMATFLELRSKENEGIRAGYAELVVAAMFRLRLYYAAEMSLL
jgi:hypothetical protein